MEGCATVYESISSRLVNLDWTERWRLYMSIKTCEFGHDEHEIKDDENDECSWSSGESFGSQHCNCDIDHVISFTCIKSYGFDDIYYEHAKDYEHVTNYMHWSAKSIEKSNIVILDLKRQICCSGPKYGHLILKRLEKMIAQYDENKLLSREIDGLSYVKCPCCKQWTNVYNTHVNYYTKRRSFYCDNFICSSSTIM